MRRSWILAAMLLACGAPAAAEMPRNTSPIAGYVTEAAQRAGIPEAWIWSVMRVESAGDVRAVSRAGAMGLMQLMPATWVTIRQRLGLGNDPFDPHDNVLAGAFFLRAMHDRYGAPGFLAAYNAGPGRYEDYLHRRRALPAETIAYLARLAPAVGGAPVADPNAWMRAGLFAGPAAVQPGAPATLAQSGPADTPKSDGPPSNPLFVRTSNVVSR